MPNARALLQEVAQDSAGNALGGKSVYVYEVDRVTPLIQTMYATLSGSATLTNPLTTDTTGLARAYTTTPQRVSVRVGTGTFYDAEFEPDPVDLALKSGTALSNTLTFTEQAAALTDPGGSLAILRVGTDGNLYIFPAGLAELKFLKSGLVVNADIAAAAAIAASKLAAGGTANRVVATADGTTVAMQQIVDAMIGSAAAIALTKLAQGAANTALLTNAGATAVVAALIANANIDPAAAIAASKLAAGSNGQVLATTAGVPTWKNGTLNKNRVVNGGFTVQQRTMPTTDNAYSFDRWRLLLAAANASTIVIDNADVPAGGGSRDSCALVVGSGVNNKFGIFQPIEGVDIWDLRGQTASLQFKMKATAGISDVRAAVVQWTGTEDAVSADPISVWGATGTVPTYTGSWANANTPANLNPTTSWATYQITNISISASATNLAVFIWSEDTSTTQTTDILRITDVQLEAGADCTAIERLSLAETDRLCKWWYEVLGSGVGSEHFGIFVTWSTTLGITSIKYLPKRVAPTITVSASGDFLHIINGGTKAGASITVGEVGLTTATMNDTTSALTAAQAGYTRANNTSARVKIEASL